MLAWGNACSSWDDSVDIANLEEFDYGEIPEAKLVMTTWHEKESIKEVFWFAKNNAFHPLVELKNTLLLDIAFLSHKKEYLFKYEHV